MAVVALVAVVVIHPESVAGEEPDETSAIEQPEIDGDAVEGTGDKPGEVANDPALAEAIEAVLDDDELRRTDVGIYVRDLDAGEVLYARDADRLMNPASNVKLVTAAIALENLGPNHTFTTELWTRANSDGSLDDLYVRGEGEAFLQYKDVLSWAGDLRRRGIDRIDGDVVIDDGAFDGAYLPPGFDMRDVGAAYRSPIGAVSVNFNAISVEVEPGDAIGSPAKITVSPPNNYVEVINRTETVYGQYPQVEVRARPGDDGMRLIVDGVVGNNANAMTRRKRIDDPPAFAGSVVAEAMRMVGIEFDGDVTRGRIPDDGTKLVDHQSKPLMLSLRAMNKWSNNFIAEQLLRVVGVVDDEPSTWEAARLRASRTLVDYGLDEGTYNLHNGSGLYDGNELSPRQIVTLLDAMRDHPYGAEFASTLAIAGVDGTLRRRLDDGVTEANLRGKTGTLRNVTALSGYVQTVSGRNVGFSIMFNDPPRRAWNYRDDQDDIARAIAEFDG